MSEPREGQDPLIRCVAVVIEEAYLAIEEA